MRSGADARRRQVYASLRIAHLICFRARSLPGAPQRHSPRQSQPALAQPQAVFPGTRLWRVSPAFACPSPARSAQTGRFAGPTVSRAARVRGYESRPRAPHSLQHRYVTGDAPRTSEMDCHITEIVTKVKCIVPVLVTALRVPIGVKRKSTGRQIRRPRSKMTHLGSGECIAAAINREPGAVLSNYIFGASATEMQEANVFSRILGSMLPAAPMATICVRGARSPHSSWNEMSTRLPTTCSTARRCGASVRIDHPFGPINSPRQLTHCFPQRFQRQRLVRLVAPGAEHLRVVVVVMPVVASWQSGSVQLCSAACKLRSA